MPSAVSRNTPLTRPQRPPTPTRSLTVVNNYPGKPGNANPSGKLTSPPVPPRRHHVNSKQLAPSPAALTVEQRIRAIKARLANSEAEMPIIDASQMMRELTALIHDRRATTSDRDSIQRTMNAVMRHVKEQLYKKEGLNIKKSSSWPYRLLAKIPFTRQHRIKVCLEKLNSIRS